MKQFFLQLTVAGLTAINCYGQQFYDKDIDVLIQKVAKTMSKDARVNSVSIGIFKEQSTYSYHFGELDREKKNPPTDETIYPIASVTKTMTGYLAAMAVLEGKFNLDDDIRKYLNGQYPNLSYKGEPIKIRHLMTHTSRLPAEIVGLEPFLQKGDMNGALAYVKSYRKDQFFSDLKSVVLDTIPSTKYLYSSNGTNLLGYILENVYQTPFAELLDKNIFKRTGMKDTKLELNEDQKNRVSKGHDGQGNVTPEQPRFLLGADGYIKSTTADLLQYMRFQLSEENSIARESRRQINAHLAPMGYFWQIENKGTITFYKHAGTAIGTTNWLVLCPEKDIGISIIINSRFPESVDVVYNAAIDILMIIQG